MACMWSLNCVNCSLFNNNTRNCNFFKAFVKINNFFVTSYLALIGSMKVHVHDEKMSLFKWSNFLPINFWWFINLWSTIEQFCSYRKKLLYRAIINVNFNWRNAPTWRHVHSHNRRCLISPHDMSVSYE